MRVERHRDHVGARPACSAADQPGLPLVEGPQHRSWNRVLMNCGLVGDVPVEHHPISARCVAEAAHGQSVHTVAVDDAQRSLQDRRPAELTVFRQAAATGGSRSSAPSAAPLGGSVICRSTSLLPSSISRKPSGILGQQRKFNSVCPILCSTLLTLAQMAACTGLPRSGSGEKP